MKTLALSVCLAVAATASAADLKDPAEVATDWNATMSQAREPVLPGGALGLAALSPAPQLNLMPRATPHLRQPHLNGDVLELPPGWQLDPKIQKSPGASTDTPPPGAKLWSYHGQKFWIIPVAPGAPK